jgi:hypothetical protein
MQPVIPQRQQCNHARLRHLAIFNGHGKSIQSHAKGEAARLGHRDVLIIISRVSQDAFNASLKPELDSSGAIHHSTQTISTVEIACHKFE